MAVDQRPIDHQSIGRWPAATEAELSRGGSGLAEDWRLLADDGAEAVDVGIAAARIGVDLARQAADAARAGSVPEGYSGDGERA